MDAGTLSIKDMFGKDCRYAVPLFQRPYVWNKEDQWEPLWEDVRGLADRVLAGNNVRPHFLGAVVLDHLRTQTGYLESRLVIDGQQRLTTIQLLLEAFSDLCANFEEKKYHQALVKLTRNDDPMSDDADEEFKIWPTNVDQEDFRKVMLAESSADLRRIYGVNPGVKSVGLKLGDAYLFFHATIKEWLDSDEEALGTRIEALYRVLRESIRMVVIDLGKEDDAQLIFETLNARGTPLQPSDLVKNLLFHRVQSQGGDLEKLYQEHWKPFDTEPAYWREEIARGRLKRPRLDVFLQHYLTLRIKDEVLVTHLYKVFQGYLETGSTSALDELASIQRYAKVFRGFDHLPAHSREAVFFARLVLMETTTAYPFLLELFARHSDQPEEIRSVLIDLESFLVRRMVCRLTTKNYNRVFVEMLSLLTDSGGGDGIAARVRETLLRFDGDSTRWPRDPAFREAWLNEPAYKAQVRRRVRMILEAIESAMHTGMTEDFELNDKLTVEHVLPQEWREHWAPPPGDPPELAAIERNRLLHTFGNLTLVTSKLNPSISNGPWSKKRKALEDHSILLMNKRLRREVDWTEEAIRRRGEETFDLARTIWDFPEE